MHVFLADWQGKSKLLMLDLQASPQYLATPFIMLRSLPLVSKIKLQVLERVQKIMAVA